MFTHSKMEVTNGFISFDHIFIVQKNPIILGIMHKLHTLNYPLPLDLFVHITIARIAAKKTVADESV